MKILYSLILTFFLIGCESTVKQTAGKQSHETQPAEKLDPENATPPIIIRKIKPVYPDELRRKKIIGEAVIEIIVLPDGTPTNLRVHSATHDAFGISSLKAARNLLFEPATIDGVPVSCKILLPVTFDPKNQKPNQS